MPGHAKFAHLLMAILQTFLGTTTSFQWRHHVQHEYYYWCVLLQGIRSNHFLYYSVANYQKLGMAT